MQTITYIFTREEFLQVIRNHCVQHNWPIVTSDFTLELLHDSYYLKEAHIRFTTTPIKLHKATKHHICIESDWFDILVKTRYPNATLPNKFEAMIIGDSKQFDLCLFYRKFSVLEFIKRCFKRIF